MAGFVCVIANACGHMKRQIKPEDLIGRNPKAKRNAKAEAADRIAQGKAFAQALTERMNKPKEA